MVPRESLRRWDMSDDQRDEHWDALMSHWPHLDDESKELILEEVRTRALRTDDN